jgi:excisionase family DNA binding protein
VAESQYISARRAAELAGVSEKTIRNWIAVGKLSAERSAAGFRIARDQLEPLIPRSTRTSAPAERNGAESADSPQTPSADRSAAMLELVHLVAQLQGDVVAKVEAAAMWQTRAELPAIQL